MPLNINENDPAGKKEKEKPLPITHTVREGNPYFTKTTILILAAATVVAGIFLLSEYDILHLPFLSGGREPITDVDSVPEKNQDSGILTFPPSSPSGKDRVSSFGTVTDTGKFVVYIGAYRSRSDAEEEVGRWIAAGFKSFVDDHDGWHRVSFGRYVTLGAAKSEAEQWKQAFEYGYWIGELQ
jgi:hypothetical protein